jgi:hypothetical protein
MLLSEICGLVSVRRPLWREDGCAICSVITQWSESRRTRNHSLLSHLRLPQPGGPGSRIYVPQEQGGPVIPAGTGFPLCHLLRLASYEPYFVLRILICHSWGTDETNIKVCVKFVACFHFSRFISSSLTSLSSLCLFFASIWPYRHHSNLLWEGEGEGKRKGKCRGMCMTLLTETHSQYKLLGLSPRRTIPTEETALVGEVNANVCVERVSRDHHDGSLRPYSRFSRPELLSCTHEAEWTPFQTHYFSEKSGSAGSRTRTSGSVARNSDH